MIRFYVWINHPAGGNAGYKNKLPGPMVPKMFSTNAFTGIFGTDYLALFVEVGGI